VKTGRILVVDDDEDILTAGRLLLRRQFAEVFTCSVPGQIPELLGNHDFDVVLLDMNFGPGESSGQQGLEWLKAILEIDPSEKIVATVSAGLQLHRSRIEAQSLREANRVLIDAASPRDNAIVGSSSQMQQVLSVVERTAPTDANVLILGENGTGKELIARELHRRSQRADQVFLTVDMGSISETLFESELFGHKKGAFTGADDDRTGRFQAADGGTLFLDEIGNLALPLQAKLLRVLEERTVTAVGADKPQAIDVRVIAATNVAPSALRNKDQFRQDLLFRLNTVEITVPPLRDRRDDVLPIAKHFLEIYSRKYSVPDKSFAPQAESALIDYEWPGNVRALRHSVERAVILSSGDVIEAEDLQLQHGAESTSPERQDSVLNLEQVEKETIAAAVRKHGFNISHAARELGLTRASLYRRMEKHGL